MKLSPLPPWLNDPAVVQVCAVIQSAGYEIYFVGGCVRNAILGEKTGDLDLSSNALPQTVMQLAKDAGLKAIPTGIDHGTVTVVAQNTPFEITTFRRDVATDGRRAVVAFSQDIHEDARRRDFSMNALYLRPDGTLVDPLNGLKDTQARRIRFIEDAQLRIREDYLRILRFFRFSAFYGSSETGFEAETLDAIGRNLEGLKTLSPERVGMEMLKLLSAPNPAPTVACMAQCGVLAALFTGMDTTTLGPLIHLETQLGLRPDPIRRLATLGGENLQETLRLSKAQSKKLALYKSHIGNMMSPAELGYRLGKDLALDVLALRLALFGQMPLAAHVSQINLAAKAVFPIKAADIMDQFSGPSLGSTLRNLEDKWIASEFQMNKSELLAAIQ